MDLRGSNGSEEIERIVRQGIAAAAPFIVDSAVETVRDGGGRSKRYFPGR